MSVKLPFVYNQIYRAKLATTDFNTRVLIQELLGCQNDSRILLFLGLFVGHLLALLLLTEHQISERTLTSFFLLIFGLFLRGSLWIRPLCVGRLLNQSRWANIDIRDDYLLEAYNCWLHAVVGRIQKGAILVIQEFASIGLYLKGLLRDAHNVRMVWTTRYLFANLWLGLFKLLLLAMRPLVTINLARRRKGLRIQVWLCQFHIDVSIWAFLGFTD